MSGFANSVIGGAQKLIRKAIQSPNFIHGLSGWTVNKDGSAEFQDVSLRGSFSGNTWLFNSAGFYLYSGTPASGNLIQTIGITAPGTDPIGLNAVLPGDTRYHNNGAGIYVAQQSTQSYVAYLWQATSPLGPYVANNAYVSFTNEFTSQPVTQVAGPLVSLTAVGAGGMGGAQSFTVVPASGDATGAEDFSNITLALSLGAVQLAPGTYYLKAPVTLSSGSCLDMGAATVQPGSLWSQVPPVAMFTLNSNCTLKYGILYGGGNTRNLNPATDAITLSATAVTVRVEGITCNFMNGNVFTDTVPVTRHCTISRIMGTNNAGGIKIAATTPISAQYNISDVNLQRCEVSEALYLANVFDVGIGVEYNCSVLGTAGVPTVHLLGQCTTCLLHNINAGVQGTPTAGVPVLHVEDSGGHSVTDCRFTASTYQAGGIGIMVDGGTARCQFIGVAARNNAGDGWQFNGTGTGLAVSACYGNTNTGAGDVNVTGTAHVGLDHFAYCSAGVANSLIVPVTNHVSNDNPTSPGGKAVSGTPAGW